MTIHDAGLIRILWLKQRTSPLAAVYPQTNARGYADTPCKSNLTTELSSVDSSPGKRCCQEKDAVPLARDMQKFLSGNPGVVVESGRAEGAS